MLGYAAVSSHGNTALVATALLDLVATAANADLLRQPGVWLAARALLQSKVAFQEEVQLDWVPFSFSFQDLLCHLHATGNAAFHWRMSATTLHDLIVNKSQPQQSVRLYMAASLWNEHT